MRRSYLVTGGAGFIGANCVHRLLSRGEDVTIYDNLSRAGSKQNLTWLNHGFGKGAFELAIGDVRDIERLKSSVAGKDVIIHLAAQVAVTTSVEEPREDFDINALGTFNVMEAARISRKNPIVIYASTNKVYGAMEALKVVEEETRYRFADFPYGIPETFPLDFHSPYGCSKGCGDQYVRDYSRIYGIPSVVFRQSCIYGPRQFGIEDQGWVAWFVIAAVIGEPITIYGDGKQVRDLLYISDLLDAYDSAIIGIHDCAGKIYNIGGGRENAISIWKEFGLVLKNLMGKEIPIQINDWRAGDQKVYISDIRKAKKELKWSPKIDVETGIQRLSKWVIKSQSLF
ncbi:MAG TPA: NAD-dependent epimerase/dehydratase family protein [Anaerolineae bacterium]|nr:NAD-dependent epimerase/dehydratase family protein [Anaerolineae bacterium]